MFGRCQGSIWQTDDFSQCFKHECVTPCAALCELCVLLPPQPLTRYPSFLQFTLPVAVCALSLFHLLIAVCRAVLTSKYYYAYTLLNHWSHVWDLRETGPDANGSLTECDSDSGLTDVDDEIARNTELALHPTVSQADRLAVVEADRPRGQGLRVLLEALLATGNVMIAVAMFVIPPPAQEDELVEITRMVVWSYIALLVVVRLGITLSSRLSFSTPWYHTAILYGFQWILNALLLRSYIIHPPNSFHRSLMIGHFAITTCLLFIALASRMGNKQVELEYEGDIPPAREPTASLFSIATFSWVDSIVWTGYNKTFELADVWNLSPEDKAAQVLSSYRQVKKTTALAYHLLRYFKTGLIAQALWAAFSGFLTFAPTMLLKSILEYVENPQSIPRNSAWFFVLLLFVSGCCSALADGMALWIGRKICIRLRAIIIGEIYSKALKRKAGAAADKVLGEKASQPAAGAAKGPWARLKARLSRKKKSQQVKQTDDGDDDAPANDAQVTSGAIINLMAVDSFKVSEISAYLHFLWANTPVQVVLAVVLLYTILGYSSIAGIGTMIVLLPINMWISQRFSAIQKKILAATDARINTTNEVLTNIRIIKFFAWEQRFMDNVNEKRQKELAHLRSRYILWSLAATIWGGAPILITFLSFAFYTFVEKKALIPSVAFTALSLFQILRIPLDQLADMVAHVQESKVSVDRIEEFLSEEDTQKYRQLKHSGLPDSETIIGFDHATFTWGSKSSVTQDLASSFRMIDLNLRFVPGGLNVIAGPTGSGKTSLLMALLGEMTKIQGLVFLPGARSREDVSADPQTGMTETVAYCAQQAWLVNDTVKQNIVFASPWDGRRYKQVVEACSLKKDFEILDDGDETLVGEKGVTLSGGQKQRISLARAIYSNARHLLLDDILSAVDAHTAKWIFEKAITGPLMFNRTCILVTHNVTLCLPEAQNAVILDNGRVAAFGDVDAILKSGKLGDELTKSTANSTGPSRPDTPTHALKDSAASGSKDVSDPVTNELPIESLPTVADKKDDPLAGPAKATATPSANAMKEGKAEGGVKMSIITMYLGAMGGFSFWLAAAAAFTLQQLSNVSTNVWIRQWANAYAQHDYDILASPRHVDSPVAYVRGFSAFGSCASSGSCTWNIPMSKWSNFTYQARPLIDQSIMASQPVRSLQSVDAGFYLGVYAALGAVYMLITFGREYILFLGSITASRKIHRDLMEKVSHARFRFFDSTPLGQIMNRFSKDVENVDQEIAPVAVGVVHCLASIITIVILISIITPGFLIAGVFISVLYFLIGKFYINSSRDLKRIESVQRSPLYQHFGETLSGMVTIRAYGDERRFIRDNLNKVNTHNRPFIYLWAANRWLAFRVDVSGALVSFFAGIFVVLSVGKIDAGAAGLAMTYAVTFTENVLWFVRLYASNEQNMNSVERIKEYLDVEQEAPANIVESQPPADWPSKGEVEFKNYSTRYRKELEPVLRGLTFKIAPCEKIGVVGRTGAGKSSLAMALFRALEAEEGSISIDGVDISKIGLRDLRENIVMVPQDPTLFTGTIRSNLDPFSLFTDEEIFTALRRVQLVGSSGYTASAAAVPSKFAEDDEAHGQSHASSDSSETAVGTPSATTTDNKNVFLRLSSPISESGSNLSQGQRQLLCLARALLKSPKVLLMDEATASIDYATDSKIQETIRELKGNTIITIAHRLKTIVDYDRVIVMERGRVVEYGEPWTLLRTDKDDGDDVVREDGKRWFREMCETSGEMQSLEEEAQRSYRARRLVDDS